LEAAGAPRHAAKAGLADHKDGFETAQEGEDRA
jgi:hypothetical protein